MVLIYSQVAVPIHVAKVMTYPERVTTENIELMKFLIINGFDIFTGCCSYLCCQGDDIP